MKILKHGKKPTLEMKIICRNCTCECLVEKKDLRFQSDQRDGDFYYFKCPDCQSEQIVTWQKWQE